MKKAFDQTVRDLKRGVNKKVLKVPSIEQKVLDATSNEPWGPHGTLLADIAQATRNYHEYQMIMSVLWKRIHDTGKNWRHVYKALTVLEYMVAHGSERVIEDIREHANQIQTLSDFQYIDSRGSDQGSNVRKKSQQLVVLVNDKERIQEVRAKVSSYREKFRSSPAGNMYVDDHYVSRGNERNGNGGGREYEYTDHNRYGRDGDRYGREYEERYGGDDDYRGRSRSVDNRSSRGRSSDRDKYDDDDHYSSRGSGAKADEQSQDGSRTIHPKFLDQNLGAPSYGEAVSGARHSPTYRERDRETLEDSPKPSSPPASSSPTQAISTAAPASAPNSPVDPRGSYSADSTTSSSAAPTMSVGGEMDWLVSSSESFTGNTLASMATSVTSSSEFDSSTSLFTFTPSDAPSMPSQGFGDPFGDGPFKAMPSQSGTGSQQHRGEGSFSGETSTPFGESSSQYQQQEFSTHDPNIDILADILPPTGPHSHVHPVTEYAAPVSQAVSQSEFLPQTDQNVSLVTFSSQNEPLAHQTYFLAQSGHPSLLADQTGENLSQATFSSQSGPSAQQIGFAAQSGQPTALTSFPYQPGQLVVHPHFPTQVSQQAPQAGFGAHGGQPSPLNGYVNQAAEAPQTGFTYQMNQSQHGSFQGPGGQVAAPTPVSYGNYHMQPALAFRTTVPQVFAGSTSQVNATNFSVASQKPYATGQLGSSAMVASRAGLPSTSSTSSAAPPSKERQFVTKSTVWTDTLTRGLLNLDISGVKTNPLSDIGVDFDAINRKEKRMEKIPTGSVTSTLHMGKAMGSGSGMGRAGAIRPPAYPMMNTGTSPGIGMMGMEQQPAVGMGGYSGMNLQTMGAGTGINMSTGGQMQQATRFPPGSNMLMQGGYNPMMGAGNYGKNPYVDGY